MRTLLGVSIAVVVLAAATLPAKAGTEFRYQNAQGGIVCQLSIPTVDTMARAKATGFRNEGTTNAFVIYSAVTALVAWAAFKGKLMPFDDIDWPWLAAAGAALAANIISILRTLVWSPKRLGAPHDPT